MLVLGMLRQYQTGSNRRKCSNLTKFQRLSRREKVYATDQHNATAKTHLKELALKYHYIIQMCEQETIEVLRVATEDNTADLFTKPVSKATFIRLIERLKGRRAML